MNEYVHRPIFALGEDNTPYRKISAEGLGTTRFKSHQILTINSSVLTHLAAEAFKDVSHMLRPAHLKQLASILEDPEASDNDKFVALDLLKNANIAAAGTLPMCQDTGNAIIMANKGQHVWTSGGDEAALAAGVHRAFAKNNLRYSMVAPLDMFHEVNTGNNMPAQIDLFATEGDNYSFLFIA